jgi:NADPH-dependent 2,4-dienoyl-CoA reductase/sulfur reductase-like enzyme/peroxiredoxin family protein/TusA-related sulfurtransferase/rhodanese-related sulfurtransferase
MAKRIIVVGGVAGGMSCAARLKRLDASLDVTVFEKGPDVSFANCGMPYYIGGIINDRGSMAVQTPGSLRSRYGLDIFTRHEVMSVDAAGRTVTVRNLDTGAMREEEYDQLVLATGAEPVRLPIPGADASHVFILSNLADMDSIAEAAGRAKAVCVIGAGFIGLELAENLRERGLKVHVVEVLDQVLAPMDREMTAPLAQELRLNGVNLELSNAVERIGIDHVVLRDGRQLRADFVCMCAGVRPRSELAKQAGLKLGARGHVAVDEAMRTSDPNIFAVGDAVEVRDVVANIPTAVPLAGPANRQGRIAADVICGRASKYPGIQGSSIVKVFNLAAAQTGWTEKRLKAAGMAYKRVYAHPTQHAKYYPDAQMVGMKMLFADDGGIFGAQMVGTDGVEVGIDVIATAMRGGLSVYDLEQLELAYSPQWGAAKHGINMLGFVASNMLRGDTRMIEPDEVASDVFWLDVRMPAEAEAGIVPGAVVIPLDELAGRLNELPRDRDIALYCAVGLRGYIAERMLTQKGFRVRNLNGGYRTWCWYHAMDKAGHVAAPRCDKGTCFQEAPKKEKAIMSEKTVQLDVCGLQCPGPMVQVKKSMDTMHSGEVLEVVASDPGFAADIPAWCASTGNTLLEVKSAAGRYVARVQRGAAPSLSPAAPAATGKTIVCFSGDLDKVLAAFVIANGAAAMGSKTTLFFTFWGLNALRKDNPPSVSKGIMDRMFGWMMPRGANRLTLSKMHMGGMGTAMMKMVMKGKNVLSLPELIAAAQSAGIKMVACSMSMDVMGLKPEELIDGIEIGGVGAFLGAANESNATLFI